MTCGQSPHHHDDITGDQGHEAPHVSTPLNRRPNLNIEESIISKIKRDLANILCDECSPNQLHEEEEALRAEKEEDEKEEEEVEGRGKGPSLYYDCQTCKLINKLIN
jgi:hypothetical protein